MSRASHRRRAERERKPSARERWLADRRRRNQVERERALSSLAGSPRLLFVDGRTATPPASQDGSLVSPFSTIQAALDATSGVGAAWEIVVIPNSTVPEALVFPANRSISVMYLGGSTSPGGGP